MRVFARVAGVAMMSALMWIAPKGVSAQQTFCAEEGRPPNMVRTMSPSEFRRRVDKFLQVSTETAGIDGVTVTVLNDGVATARKAVRMRSANARLTRKTLREWVQSKSSSPDSEIVLAPLVSLQDHATADVVSINDGPAVDGAPPGVEQPGFGFPQEKIPPLGPKNPEGVPLDEVDVTTLPSDSELAKLDLAVEQTQELYRRRQLADSVALVTIHDAKDDVVGYCNAVHIGDGEFLTNRHCVYGQSYGLWLGDIDWPKDGQITEATATLACRAIASDWAVADPAPNAPAKFLDVAKLIVPDGQFSAHDRFAKASVSLPDADPWCGGTPETCSKNVTPGTELSMIQVWSIGFTKGATEAGVKRGSKTVSTPPDAKAPKKNKATPCSANVNLLDAAEEQKLRACKTKDDDKEKFNIGSFGYPHTCDSDDGNSGAPIFFLSEVDRFLKKGGDKPELAAMHRSGSRRFSNCAVPASLLKK